MEEPIFKEWPKIHRLNRIILVTEKIDGTNGLVWVGEDGTVRAGSRSRWITPQNDNHGFAKWVEANQDELRKLGPGYHYGEWWGNGIQRGYGQPSGVKHFSLFNVLRWGNPAVLCDRPACCRVVPLLYHGLFNQAAIEACLYNLKTYGSQAAPFMNPEGVVIYHTQANAGFKITLENDEKGKDA